MSLLDRCRRWLRSGAGAAATVGLVLAGCAVPGSEPAGTESASDLRVVRKVNAAQGFDRSCSRGRGCVFGPAWSDAVGVRLGRNGCSTNLDLLKERLTDVTIRPGTHGCVVESGWLRDPYTGAVVQYRRGDPAQPVEVDHVVALRAAWDRGASGWPLQRRKDFANDPRGLIVTTAKANASKSDKSPEYWSPANAAGRCTYARAFVIVSRHYDLIVTAADVDALDAMLADCR